MGEPAGSLREPRPDRERARRLRAASARPDGRRRPAAVQRVHRRGRIPTPGVPGLGRRHPSVLRGRSGGTAAGARPGRSARTGPGIVHRPPAHLLSGRPAGGRLHRRRRVHSQQRASGGCLEPAVHRPLRLEPDPPSGGRPPPRRRNPQKRRASPRCVHRSRLAGADRRPRRHLPSRREGREPGGRRGRRPPCRRQHCRASRQRGGLRRPALLGVGSLRFGAFRRREGGSRNPIESRRPFLLRGLLDAPSFGQLLLRERLLRRGRIPAGRPRSPDSRAAGPRRNPVREPRPGRRAGSAFAAVGERRRRGDRPSDVLRRPAPPTAGGRRRPLFDHRMR